MNLRISVEGEGCFFDEQAQGRNFKKALLSVEGLQEIIVKQTLPGGRRGTGGTYATYRLTFGPRGGLKVERFEGDMPEKGE
jgi:hypothetical protein